MDGYAILQPRITPTIPSDRDRSLFQRIFAGPAGIDPYATATSDVYQDLFGEGSYTGKGIYDVAAFTAALKDRVPENSLLSHDLFEGIFARAGLVTDIELFEEFPTDYEVAAGRQYRWARGDWQLLPWIIRGDTRAGARPTWIPPVGLWKIIDNLRRTLSAPAAGLTLIVGWLLPHGLPLVWTAFVLATIALPSLLPAFDEIIPKRSGISKRTHFRSVGRSFTIAASQIALGITFLAHQAWLMGDAIGRTLVRLYLTRRRLLEWTTAAQAKSDLSRDITGAYRRMGGALVLAAAAGALVVWLRPSSLAVAAPFLLLWSLSPAVARWVSRPPVPSPQQRLSPEDSVVLRSTARRTWRFFESFVGPDDTFLPPDNFQEDPRPVLAHRTSPTNIGLYLLAVIVGPGLRLARASSTRWSASRRPWRRCAASSASAATSTTGTTRPGCARWSPATSPPWTAVTSPRISSPSATRVAARSTIRFRTGTSSPESTTPSISSGRPPPRSRMATAARPSPSASSPRPATPWARRFATPPGARRRRSARVRRLAGYADTLVDIARVLDDQRRRTARAPASWSGPRRRAPPSRATRATSRRLMPWADTSRARPPRSRARSRRLFSSPPSPAELPERCRVAISELTAARDGAVRAGADAAGRDRAHRRAHRKPGALRRGLSSARRAPAGRRPDDHRALRGDAVRLPLRPDPQDLLDRLSRLRRQSRRQRTTISSPRKRGSRASSPSPRATSPSRTGSTSAAR